MDLSSAEAFVAVVNLGTLQRAAERLGVSAATISRRLTSLEAELGVRLVERTTRSLRVTALGQVFHERCARGLNALAEAGDLVASSQTRVAGTVRLSVAPNLAPLLLDALVQVQKHYPEVALVLVETERLLDHHRDDVDLFVRVGAVGDGRLVARPLGRYPHVLVASKAYLARAGRPRRPADLEHHRIIAFDGGQRPARAVLVPVHGGPVVQVKVRPHFASNDYETIARVARRGLGIAELPAILDEQRAGLVRVLPRWTLGEVPLNLLFAADRLLPRTVRVVVDAIMALVPARVQHAVKDLAQ